MSIDEILLRLLHPTYLVRSTEFPVGHIFTYETLPAFDVGRMSTVDLSRLCQVIVRCKHDSRLMTYEQRTMLGAGSYAKTLVALASTKFCRPHYFYDCAGHLVNRWEVVENP